MIIVTPFGTAKVTKIVLLDGAEIEGPTAESWPQCWRWRGVLLDGEYEGRPIEGPPGDAEPITQH